MNKTKYNLIANKIINSHDVHELIIINKSIKRQLKRLRVAYGWDWFFDTFTIEHLGINAVSDAIFKAIRQAIDNKQAYEYLRLKKHKHMFIRVTGRWTCSDTERLLEVN